jgi:dimethylaniline monooxygenase (N-oxide forming)
MDRRYDTNDVQLDVLKIPKDSPLRNTHSMFWGIRTNDEGTGRNDGFHAIAKQERIDLVALTMVKGHASSKLGFLGQPFSLVFTDIFIPPMLMTVSEKTIKELGIGRYLPSQDVVEWKHYKMLASSPAAHPQRDQWTLSIYRGLVPVKNITERDFAIKGALVRSIILDKYLDVFLIHNTVQVTFHIS